MQNQYYWALTDDVIAHHGILGQKWGVRRFQDYNGKRIGPKEPTSPQGLSDFMKKNISYDSSTHPLKTTEQLLKDKSGNCHDQTLYEMEMLKKMGKNPKAMFLIEVDDQGQGGTTHSFVYYKENKKIKYLENAWGGHEGIKEFDKVNDIKDYFKETHSKGEFGNDINRFKHLYFGDFKGQPGDSLQDIVDKSLD